MIKLNQIIKEIEEPVPQTPPTKPLVSKPSINDVKYDAKINGIDFEIKFDINKNDTKKGIKMKFFPKSQTGKQPQELVNIIQKKVEEKLIPLGLAIDFDPDAPEQNVIPFTIKLGDVAQLIVNKLKGTV